MLFLYLTSDLTDLTDVSFSFSFSFSFLLSSVDNKNLDVGILGYGIEAGAALLPFGRCVFAPDAAVSHYLCVGVFLTEYAEELAQRGFLLRCAVVVGYNKLTTYLSDAADISDVDGGGVVALHSVAHCFNGEHLMDAVVSVSGSSPAYVYMMIEAMADAAVADGMPRPQAYQFAAQAVMGSAKMVLETGKHPGELKDMVCSPKGTTIEAVRVLEEKGFRSAVFEAVKACVKKTREV